MKLINQPLMLPRSPRKQIATEIGAALIGGGAKLISGLFGKSAQDKANETNLQIAREQNAFNQKMWEQQRDYNTEMWNMSNEYNDPAAQMQRLKNAGLSDWAAASAVSGSPSTATPMSSPAAAPAAGASVQAPDMSFLSAAMDTAIENYQAVKLRDEQIRLAAAQADKAETEASQASDFYRDFFRDLTRSQLDNSLYDQHNKKHDATLKLQQIGLNAGTFNNTIKQSKITTDLLTQDLVSKELENTAKNLENRMQQLRFENLPKELAATLALIGAKIKAAIDAGAASRASAKASLAQALYTESQDTTWKLTHKHAETLADEALSAAQANTTLLQNQAWESQFNRSYDETPAGSIYKGIGRGLSNLLPILKAIK